MLYSIDYVVAMVFCVVASALLRDCYSILSGFQGIAIGLLG